MQIKPRKTVNESQNAGERMALQFLQEFVEVNQVTELFVKHTSGPEQLGAVSLIGYYDQKHLGQLVSDALAHSGRAEGVFYRINPVRPALLARSENCLQPITKVATGTGADVVRRRLFLIDVDPRHESDAPASESERGAARNLATKIQTFLRDQGWPDPALVDSGNGMHILLRVDLEANDGELLKRVLKALAVRFDDEHAAVDTAVADAARLARLPGTWNCKGCCTDQRPHRPCKLVSLPKSEWMPVPRELLERVAADSPPSADLSTPIGTELRKVIASAQKYINRMPPAIAGLHGHDQTFKVASRLVVGFDLTPDQAWPVMLAYNLRCRPPWSDKELRRKLEQADQVARAADQHRGGLRSGRTGSASEYVGWEPLKGKEFIGWVPDFGDGSAWDVLMSLSDFQQIHWSLWADYFCVWRLMISHPLIPDVLVRQLYWGAHEPRNWRREIRKWRNQQLLETTRHQVSCNSQLCLLAAASIRHEHFPTIIKGWGFLDSTTRWHEPTEVHPTYQDVDDYKYYDLEEGDSDYSEIDNGDETESERYQAMDTELPCENGFTRGSDESIQYPPTEFCSFPLYDKQFSKQLKQARQSGKVIPVYWPALLFGASPRVGWTSSQQRLLVAIVREITRADKTSSPEIIFGNRIVTAGIGTQTVLCPLLDPDLQYVVFGGNGKRSGRGYQIIGRTFRGWLWRAGYRLDVEADSSHDYEMTRRFLADLAHLAKDLDLVVVGCHPRHLIHKWRGIDALLNCLRTRGGREWLNECTLRVFARADFLVRWRYFFARRLGFCWIPRSVDDAGPVADHPEHFGDEIRTGDQAGQWLTVTGFTQADMAQMLSDCLGFKVSRKRVGRLIAGEINPPDLYAWINQLRRTYDKSHPVS